jgi:hypothetical protein
MKVYQKRKPCPQFISSLTSGLEGADGHTFLDGEDHVLDSSSSGEGLIFSILEDAA